jgi:ArsR family transcriptional regulator
MRATKATIDRLEIAFKALADRTRLRILALLDNNEVCVCHLHDALGLPQPTVSRHLAYLRRTGLVSARRDGVWMHYRVSPSLSPEIRLVVDAAVRALTSVNTTAKDRAQFAKAFGPLYVMPTEAGGACCTPRG